MCLSDFSAQVVAFPVCTGREAQGRGLVSLWAAPESLSRDDEDRDEGARKLWEAGEANWEQISTMEGWACVGICIYVCGAVEDSYVQRWAKRCLIVGKKTELLSFWSWLAQAFTRSLPAPRHLPLMAHHLGNLTCPFSLNSKSFLPLVPHYSLSILCFILLRSAHHNLMLNCIDTCL